MDILDLAREQLNSADQGQIIEKHREVFAEIRNFGPKAPNYIERTGYYYGTKIARSVVEAKIPGTAFDMELPDYEDFIYSYFDL
ncbi:MAG: hypothetical protein V5A87_05700 [Candidatus Bipolaricaulota bacterium]|nr:hypothetical protein [Candidatus Bipolaricaulota bacterium]